MRAKKLSVAIITYNEENNIRRALESVEFADEIIVVDSMSSDNTVSISTEYTKKVFIRKFDDYSSQRNFSLEQAGNEWVLILDADEVVTGELKNEIIEFLDSEEDEKCVYAIERNNIFMGKRLKYSGVKNDFVIRLFPREVRYKNKVHEIPDIRDLKVVKFKNKMDHYTYRDYAHTLNKSDAYATLHAREIHKKGYKVTLGKLLIKPGFRFFRHYIFKLGFLDGKEGFIFAYLNSWGVFDKLVKTWRLEQGEKL